MEQLPKVNLVQRHQMWFYSFTFDGRRYRGTTQEQDERKARIIAERIRNQTIRRQKLAFDPFLASASLVFEKFLQIKVMDDRDQATIQSYRRYMNRFFEFFPSGIKLTDIERFQVEDWKAWLLKQPVTNNQSKGKKKTLSKTTVKEHLVWLSSVYKQMDLPNPCRGVKFPRKKAIESQEELRYFTKEQTLQLLEEANKPKDKEVYWWLVFLCYTGVRLGEAQGIRFKDIKYGDVSVFVVSDKRDEGRTIRLQAPKVVETTDADGQLLEERKDVDESQSPWFALMVLEKIARNHYEENGIEITPDTTLHFRSKRFIYKRYKTICKRAGLPSLSIHALRHTFATQALKSWNLPRLSKYLGHKDINTTYKIYGHLTTDETPLISYV